MLQVEKQPDEVIFDHLHATAFQYSPLARTILGPANNIKTISKEHLQSYIKTHYTAPRMVIQIMIFFFKLLSFYVVDHAPGVVIVLCYYSTWHIDNQEFGFRSDYPVAYLFVISIIGYCCFRSC